MNDSDGRLQLVPLDAAHREGFARLVIDVIGEFGFGFDAVLDADLANPAAYYDAAWVLTDNNVVVGSVAIRRVGREAELKRMYLRASYRGSGLGHRLLDTALDWARRHRLTAVVLQTIAEMDTARGLYEATGFRRCGQRIEHGAIESVTELLYRLELAHDSID